ncbi:FAD-dependent oxidoreductase [Saliterribacillus persicus]|uniref:Glycine/D-amino acid oxidase-like deaminating enzyme n=1 Tax=Saliterribacillus persicus TaxID=930114 RepID=A0A368XYW6_9BACI|nr:FAD-dependent oxidoreductase [Saliterribacillus persicus]RCW73280.1 glycine/D-amino acid oxidase-like deaminating enzyme [Saliterribacillus persicus]
MSNRTQAIWKEDVKIDTFPELTEDIETDIAVIGAGITGITTAYLLVKQGYRVALLEGKKVIEGTTGYTTAKITSQHGLIYAQLIETVGEKKAKEYYQANQEGLALIEQIIQDENISCAFKKQAAYVFSDTKKGTQKIEEEAKAYEKLAINGGLTKDIDLPFSVNTAIKMEGQAQFNPVKYLTSLLSYLKSKGTPIFENSRAVDIKKGDVSKVITEKGHTLSANYVVLATHFPFKDFEGLYFSKLHAERSYVVAVEAPGTISDGMYINAEDPKRSIRHYTLENGESFLLIGGEGHESGKKEKTDEAYQKLEEYAKTHFNSTNVKFKWSSQDLITLDSIPYIGPITKKNKEIFVATGYRKWGMTNGTIAAKLITDQIIGNENSFEELYSPSREIGKTQLKSFAKENSEVAKEFVKGKLEQPKKEIDSLVANEGAVVRMEGKRAGVYKDDKEVVHVVDTTCTHMGCELNWNNAEHTWDCPCHGSRFDYDGEVIEGPATKALSKINPDS